MKRLIGKNELITVMDNSKENRIEYYDSNGYYIDYCYVEDDADMVKALRPLLLDEIGLAKYFSMCTTMVIFNPSRDELLSLLYGEEYVNRIGNTYIVHKE